MIQIHARKEEVVVWVQMLAWRSLVTILPSHSKEYVAACPILSIATDNTEKAHEHSIVDAGQKKNYNSWKSGIARPKQFRADLCESGELT